MIQVLLVVTKEGEFVSCNAEGHAFFSNKGSDIVCSAVTTLLRTTLSVLESNDSITLESNAQKRGSLMFRVKKQKQDGDNANIKATSSLLVYARVFLEKGLNTLCSEYPKHVSLQINELDV